MPNQLAAGRRRSVFILDSSDYDVIEKYGKTLGYTPSVLLREAVYRLAQEIREKGKIVLIRVPRADEGHSTK